MGLLSLGTPLDWPQVQPHINHVKKHGISQFLHIWNTVKSRRKDYLLWGEEVEYCVIDLTTNIPKVSLRAEETLAKLQSLELQAIQGGNVFESSWKPEYARYMLEGTPGLPYGHTLDDLLIVEDNMIKRRALATSLLLKGEAVMSLTTFPMLGTPNSFQPECTPTPSQGSSRSLFIPEEAITRHARFPTLTSNIRQRRGEKVAINLPIYRDKHTQSPFYEPVPDCVKELLLEQGKPIPKNLSEYDPNALENHVYMDCMCFGMGCSCLQVTFQACSVEQGRRLYDHLAVMTPIMLALSASAPIFKGYLTDVDCRWNVIAGSVDDRNRQERGLEPISTGKRIYKSRYDSISRYLSPGPNVSGLCSEKPDFTLPVKGARYYKDAYNDLPVVEDAAIYEQLRQGGIDELLAKHYAHLFIRDPLVVFKELLDVDDHRSSDHFENIQSTNWQTMRFKPPTPGSDIGWRVEFRSMDIQLTDHENACFSTFIVLMARAIQYFDLNFYIPLSKLDDNIQRAQKRNAVFKEKFWFRSDILESSLDFQGPIEEEYQAYTIHEIMLGNDGNNPGIINLIDRYLDEQDISESTKQILKSHVHLIRQRVTGERKTGATWMREFIQKHPKYQHDSIITHEINYDLMQAILHLESSDLLNS